MKSRMHRIQKGDVLIGSFMETIYPLIPKESKVQNVRKKSRLNGPHYKGKKDPAVPQHTLQSQNEKCQLLVCLSYPPTPKENRFLSGLTL